jgi:hypothetical protein
LRLGLLLIHAFAGGFSWLPFGPFTRFPHFHFNQKLIFFEAGPIFAEVAST